MASSRLSEREVQQEQSAALDFCPHKYSLLGIIGRTCRHGQTAELIREELERGIRSWGVDLKSCNLNLFLQEFLSHHTASFKGAGQKCLRHCTKVLDTQVLISPSQELAHSEVFALLSRESANKLLILAGLCVEESGDLLFHGGQFSPEHLRQIITEQFPDQQSSASCPTKINLTLSCPNIGNWRKVLLGNPPLQGPFALRINPSEVLPAMESLGEFASLISGTICPASPFDLLPPPTTVGFLKMSRPCCYVFPAGRGDCAFFAVNGFTVLVDGGSDSQACFWKLVRHLDRVDAVLLTHVGTENLPGAISFLERKVAEQELRCKVRDDLSKRLISPELGVVFFNAPSKLKEEQHSFADNVLKSTQQAAITLKLLKKLDIRPQPMFRPQVVPIKPITLFQKMGVGQLDLYILTPGKSSQEYEMFMQNWPDGVTSQSFPLPALVSVSALLVWHPACPQEKLVRVLFPGATPQAKLLQGLEKLKGLDFLQTPTVTTGDLERRAEDKKARRTESLDSGRSIGKEGTAKHGKERGAREEVKDSLMKQKGKTLSGTKETDKTKIKETGIKRKPSLSEKNTLKKGLGKDGKKEDRPGNKEESSVKRTEQIKRDTVSSKTKKENKTKPKKEARNDKTGEKKTQKSSNKEANNDKKALANNRPTEQKQASLSKIAEPEFPDSGEQNHKKETEGEEKQQNSKMSTPEDITADFLQLRMESELDVAKPVRTACGNLGHATNLGGFRETACNEKVERFIVEGAGCLEKVKVEGGDNLVQKSAKAEADLLRNPLDESIKSRKPAKVGGFPTPLNKSYRSDQTDQLDTTPTEYTLLDGALKHSPPSRSSPENQGTNSPEEETAEPVSPDSRPNSAGHTPYCLSPDDVWCNRATLSRLQALDSGDTFEANGSSWQSEDRAHKTKGATENPKEKQLCFLSLGTCKEGSSDHSPSVATTTTTTTHSLPAEVSSPQSTEVDESLSMSFEQGPTVGSQKEGDDGVYLSHSNGEYHVGKSLPVKKPPRSLGQNSEMGRPAAPNTLPFEGSAHDVDLCLVSPCEFKHFKTPNSSSGTSEASREVSGSNHQGNNNNNPKDRSPSESNAPVCTEDYPSTTADGALDSDSDDSCSDPSNSPCNHDTSQTLPPDPLPAPLRDSPPLPPHPDTSMPVPQSDSEAHGKKAKTTATRGKKFPPIIDSPPIGNVKMGSQSGAVKRNLTTNRTLLSSTRSTPAKSSPAPSSKAPSAGEVSIYVDLTYIPSGASCPTVTVDFFKCIRSSCYIISGNTPEREELMSEMLDALLDGKTSWPEIMQVTVIPTFESVSMQEWYQQTLERQRELSITVLGSNSTVAMQDETFPACKIEF